jgi:hypothetical protein
LWIKTSGGVAVNGLYGIITIVGTGIAILNAKGLNGVTSVKGIDTSFLSSSSSLLSSLLLSLLPLPLLLLAAPLCSPTFALSCVSFS